jgi:predicted transcriptional regulator
MIDQIVDLKKGKEQLETLKAENLKLTSQLEMLQSAQNKLQAVPVAATVPVKVGTIVPENKIEASLPKLEPKETAEKLPVKEVMQEAAPLSEPAVRIDETVEPEIVPAAEK